jgi:hypothetical protein
MSHRSHSCRLHSRKEENHGAQSTRDHSPSSLQEPRVTHEPCKDGSPYTRKVNQCIIAPSFIVTASTELRTPGFEVYRQEDVEEGIGKSNKSPAEPYESDAEAKLTRGKETEDVSRNRRKGDT